MGMNTTAGAVGSAVAEAAAIRAFRIDVPEEQLVDLRRRLAATRLAPDREIVADATQGVQLATMQTAASFDNPDHVNIAIHNYRWRLELAQGEPQYDELEERLAKAPVISVPTITLEGDANGAFHPPASAYAAKFSGKYEHRVIRGGIGQNLPQEAPQAFAQAVIDVDGLATGR